MKKFNIVISLILVAAILFTGCSGKAASDSAGQNNNQSSEQSNNQAADPNQMLTTRLISDVTTFDPVKTNDINVQMVHYQIYEGLVREEQDHSLVPALAESWTFSEDGTEIAFVLREGVKFQNGDVVTADDVVFSLNRAIASPFTSKITSTMVEATKIDDKTVMLKLKHPYAAILGCLAASSTSIVPKKVVEADEAAFEKNPVGTGAYKLKEYVNGDKVVLEAFSDYYRGEAAIKNVTMKLMTDTSTALIALEKGEIQMMTPSQAYTDRQAIIDNPDLTYHEADQAVYFLIGFNNQKGVFTDKRLREAISYAIDRESLILGAINGVGIPVEAAMVPLCKEYPKDFKGHEYNVEKAKELLAEAGYPNGFTVTMKVIGAENYTKPAEIIQEQLRQIGITLEIETMERGAWFSDVFNGGNFEITYYAVPIVVIDPDFATYSTFHSSMINGKGNFNNVVNPELDVLLEKGRKSQDEAERAEIYKKVVEIVRDESYIIPTYTGKRTQATSANLKGVVADPMLKYYIYNYHFE